MAARKKTTERRRKLVLQHVLPPPTMLMKRKTPKLDLNIRVELEPGILMELGNDAKGAVLRATRTLVSGEVDRMQTEGLMDSATALCVQLRERYDHQHKAYPRSVTILVGTDTKLLLESLEHALGELGK